MSARPLAITKRQAKTLLKAANEEGGIIEVKIGEAFVRVIPAVLAKPEPMVDPEPPETM